MTTCLLHAGTVAAIVILAGVSPAFADAWGASWGRLDATVLPSGSGDTVLWNSAEPDKWLLHAEADVRHMHPPLSTNYGADSELWNAGGDGQVTIGPVETGDLARVLSVSARIQPTGGPYVDINATDSEGKGDVYSFAHNTPNSTSDAAGLGQHDNLFWIQYGGQGSPPATTVVSFLLEGPWNLAGDSELDDNWWADWFGYGEVYEAATAGVLASGSDYHYLAGPGPQSDGGTSMIAFNATLAYDTPYALRFFLDLETHAEAVPEPATLVLLATGGLLWSKRPRRGPLRRKTSRERDD